MSDLSIREVVEADLPKLLELYTHLHGNPYPVVTERIYHIWSKIIADANHHILIGCIEEQIVSSCVILVIENLTHQQRPYAVIENVITHPAYRKNGYASVVLSAAKDIAIQNNCYKIMLMTGSKQESTYRFYERAGFNRSDKTAFVQWL